MSRSQENTFVIMGIANFVREKNVWILKSSIVNGCRLLLYYALRILIIKKIYIFQGYQGSYI